MTFPLELTLAIIKPHITKAPHALKNIRDSILSKGFYVIKTKQISLEQDQCETFYAEHKGRFFFNRLITFMCSGPSDVHILARVDAIQQWRELMGPTKTFQAQYTAPETIRGSYGLSDTRNATHGSDSAQSAEREIRIFFPEFDVNHWLRNEENYFRNNKVNFLEKYFVHKVDHEKISNSANGSSS